MSVSRVVLPVLDLEQNDNTLHKVVLKGAKQYTTQEIAADNQSANSIQFTVTPPSQNTVMDRRIDLQYDLTVGFAVTGGGAGQVLSASNCVGLDRRDMNVDVPEEIQRYDKNGVGIPTTQSVINNLTASRGGQTFSLRQFPMASITQNLVLNINGTHLSVAPRDYVHATLMYTSDEFRKNALHDVAAHPDTLFGKYSNIFADNEGAVAGAFDVENPMRNGDGRLGEQGRGNFISFVNCSELNAAALGTSVATVTLRITEPLFISPLNLAYGEGMTNINQLKVDITFDASKLDRIFSSCADELGFRKHTAANRVSTLTNTFVPDSAKLLMRYYTPQDDIRIPNEIVLPYHQVIRHTTQLGAALAYNTATTVSGSNRRLNQIPEYLYLWVAKKQSNLDQTDSDCFADITNINIQFQNQVGILSNANEFQLLCIAQENGGDIASLKEKRERGMCLRLKFGKDIPLPNNESSGTRGDYDIQIDVTCKHYNRDNQTLEVNELYVYNGHCVIAPNEARLQTGLLDIKDNIDAEDMGDKYSAGAYGDMAGGSVWGSIKGFFKKVPHYVEKGLDIANKAKGVADQVSGMVGGSIVGGSQVGGSEVGGSAVGGKLHGGSAHSMGGGNAHYRSRRR